MELNILAQIRGFLDDVGHCINDGDRKKGAIDKLTDCLEATRTLQGLIKLPESCRLGLEEIWT